MSKLAKAFGSKYEQHKLSMLTRTFELGDHTFKVRVPSVAEIESIYDYFRNPDEAAVEAAALAFVQSYVPQAASPMCGNSIGQDRRFMARYMPQLEAWFHYRNLDVSTLKELCRRWKPEIAKGFVKRAEHTALADIRESIAELQYYREHFIRL